MKALEFLCQKLPEIINLSGKNGPPLFHAVDTHKIESVEMLVKHNAFLVGPKV